MTSITLDKPLRPQLYVQTEPCPAWEGLSSSKFRHNQRKHYTSRDALNSMVDCPEGRKHFSPLPSSPEKREKSSLKIFPSLNNTASSPIIRTVKPRPIFTPSPRPYGPCQRKHLYQAGSAEYVYSPSIRVYPDKDEKYAGREIMVEQLMQRKRVVDSLEDQRNLIEMFSPGDKPYKFPDYSPRFFHDGGLVVGSTIQFREVTRSRLDLSPLQSPTSQSPSKKLIKISMLEKEKANERMSEINSVRSLGSWEKTKLEKKESRMTEPLNPDKLFIKPNFRVKKPAKRVIFKDYGL